MTHESFETVDATGVGMETLVGYLDGPYPISRGNCFDVEVGDAFFRVLNFGVENLEELLKRGDVAWPVKVHVLRPAGANRGLCVIHDSRIPDSWYWKDFCETCTPHSLWPLPQRLQFDRGVQAGDITVTEGQGVDIISKKVFVMPGPLRVNWSIDTEELDTSRDVDLLGEGESSET